MHSEYILLASDVVCSYWWISIFPRNDFDPKGVAECSSETPMSIDNSILHFNPEDYNLKYSIFYLFVYLFLYIYFIYIFLYIFHLLFIHLRFL